VTDLRELLTDDGRAVLLLCSTLGLTDTDTAQGLAPFTLAEWNQLARQIQGSPYQRPAGLVGQPAPALSATLGCEPATAERIARLLDRGGRLALELEGLQTRSIWTVTRADPAYPARLRATLKHQAPTVLVGAGELTLLAQPGIAVVGSRNIDDAGRAFAEEVGRRCAAARVPVVSGGARGTDRIAMESCLEAGGNVLGVLADSLERTVRQPDLRRLLLDDRVVFVTPYAPSAGFSVGGAMGRNKIIYGLARAAIVVSSEFQKGGTWAGAVEALRAGWCPVFVRTGPGAPKGNADLLKLGAVAFPETALPTIDDLPAWLDQHAPPHPQQQELLPTTVAEPKTRYRSSSHP